MNRTLAAKIRRLLWQGRYFVISHAEREMENDAVFDSDLIVAAATMESLETLTDDERGPRYRCVGWSGNRRVGFIARMTPFGRLKVITAYEVKER